MPRCGRLPPWQSGACRRACACIVCTTLTYIHVHARSTKREGSCGRSTCLAISRDSLRRIRPVPHALEFLYCQSPPGTRPGFLHLWDTMGQVALQMVPPSPLPSAFTLHPGAPWRSWVRRVVLDMDISITAADAQSPEAIGVDVAQVETAAARLGR